MAFNLEDYEDVATLNKWFIANFPNGRSDISVISHDPEKGYILVQGNSVARCKRSFTSCIKHSLWI